jgi:hypothetical protein
MEIIVFSDSKMITMNHQFITQFREIVIVINIMSTLLIFFDFFEK